ncbi:MAG: hypothetical protein B7X06_04155 [Verrucomicrobia bacterium 21-51-4]|nr:MAG: hypothetical protein B7X06_04155 [Verrucomicrobia bacterium 21-51-4]
MPEDEIVKKSVIIEDLSGRIPISSKTSPQLFEALFNDLGFQLSESSLLTDSLLDWIDPDDETRLNGAEKDHYEHLHPPYSPANGPLGSYNDLRFIQGFDTLFFDNKGVKMAPFDRFKANTTLYGDYPVNLNSAPPEVLKIFCERLGVDYNTVESLLKGPDGIRGTIDDGVLDTKNFKPTNPEGLPKNTYGFETKLVKIEIRLIRGDNTFLMTALVQPGKSPTQSSTLMVRINRTLE